MYALSEEHQAVREAVRDLCDAKIAPYAAEVDRTAAASDVIKLVGFWAELPNE